jgi:hypothetical protein
MNKICPTTGKTRYPSEKAAANGLLKFTERQPDYEGSSYLCMYCGEYHFGSKKPPKKGRRKRT